MKYLSYFEEAFSALKRRENIEEILNWIICNKASSEKWLQNELGYSLNKQLGTEDMYVYPEKKRVDLPICRLGNPDEMFVATELKMISNWYTRVNYIENIKKDIEKINHNEIPSYFLLFYTYVIPKREKKLNLWIAKQIKSNIGIEGIEEFKEKIRDSVSIKIKEINPNLTYGTLDTRIEFSNEYFDRVEFGAYWVYLASSSAELPHKKHRC